METHFLSSQGRIGRAAFIVRTGALILVSVGLGFIAYSYFAHSFHHGEFATLGVFCCIVIALIAHFMVLMQLLKRLRDMNKEAYLSLLILLPGANALLLIYASLASTKQ